MLMYFQRWKINVVIFFLSAVIHFSFYLKNCKFRPLWRGIITVDENIKTSDPFSASNSQWINSFLNSEEILSVSQQPIAYSTLQRYQLQALEIYTPLANAIHYPSNEPLELRLLEEFIGGNMSPNKRPHLELMLNQARQFKDEGKFDAAFSLNERCSEEDPYDHRPIVSNAQILWKRRKIADCIKLLQKGLQRVRNEPHLIQYLANIYIKTGRRQDAMNILQLGLQEYPNYSASWLTLATLHLHKGDITTARTCYSTAVKKDPTAYACYLAWATLEFQSNDLSMTKELLTKALTIAPNNYPSWYLVVSVLISERKYAEAREFLLQCIEKEPSISRLYHLLLLVYERQSSLIDPQLIDPIVKKILYYAKLRGDAKSIVDLASFEQRQLRRIQQKINDFLLTTNSTPISIYDLQKEDRVHNLAPIYDYIDSNEMIVQLSKRYNPGTYLYEFYQLLQSQNHTLSISYQLIGYGLLKKLQEKISRIRSYYQQAILANKYFTNSWIYWSDFERTEGNYDIARKILVAGIEKFPHSRNIGKFHVSLGNLAALTKDLETSRSCYERALEVCPRHLSLSIYAKYYEMELSIGNLAKASRIYQLTLSKFPTKSEFMNKIREKYAKSAMEF